MFCFAREKTSLFGQQKRQLELQLQRQAEAEEAQSVGSSESSVSRPMSPVEQLCIMHDIEVEESKTVDEPTERDISVSLSYRN